MLPVGSPAPRVILPDQHGADVAIGAGESTGEFTGVPTGESPGPRLIVFFPAAFTPVCTAELRVVRDAVVPALPAGASVVAVSCDSMTTLRAFADAESLTFPVLSDFWPHGAASTAFDTFDEELGTARRTTYVVDPGGMIRWGTVSPLPDARDAAEYLTALAALAR